MDPDDSLVVWLAGPEGPDDPPLPLPDTLLDVGLEEAPPLVPPVPVEPVVEPPVAPVDAFPVKLPVDPPLDPPVEVPVEGPLLPLPVEVPAPLPGAGAGDALPDDVLTTAAAAGAGGAEEGPLFRAASNATLDINPVTAAKGRRSRGREQPRPVLRTVRTNAPGPVPPAAVPGATPPNVGDPSYY